MSNKKNRYPVFISATAIVTSTTEAHRFTKPMFDVSWMLQEELPSAITASATATFDVDKDNDLTLEDSSCREYFDEAVVVIMTAFAAAIATSVSDSANNAKDAHTSPDPWKKLIEYQNI